MMLLVLAGFCLPVSAVAQGEGAEAGGEEAPAKGGEAPAEEAGEEAPAEGEEAPAEGGEAPAEGGEAPAEGVEGGVEGGAPADGGPKVGPGGREMRTDYPGTEESLRERMETDRIQGVASGDVSSQEVYDLRVKELETRIDDLKDKVFRSKSRIVLLKETLLGNKIAGSKALIVQKNELGRRFKIKRMTYLLDGNVLRNEIDRDGSLSEKEQIELLNGAIGPGTHKLVVKIEFQGNAAVFGYFEGYDFTLERQCKFTVEEGMATLIDVVAYREGGATKEVEKSPKIRCDISKTQVMPDESAAEASKDEKKKKK
jgi:hypothetical protein